MSGEAGEFIEEIADTFARCAPDGWVAIHVEAPTITEVTGFTAKAKLQDGAELSFYIKDDDIEEGVIDSIEHLRRSMATQNADRGAWFTMKLDIDRDGRFSAAFDYDSKPNFDFDVSRESLLADLAEFPRSPEFYPEWLR